MNTMADLVCQHFLDKHSGGEDLDKNKSMGIIKGYIFPLIK